MKNVLLVLLVVVLPFLVSMDGCDKTYEPDLVFPRSVYIYNPCINRYETRNNEFYYIGNCCNPNYPPTVMVSFECGYYNCGFYDCLGYPWYVAPGSAMTLVRYVSNAAASSGKTKEAKQPDIEFEFTAVDPVTNESDTVVFTSTLGTIAAGSEVPYSQNIIFRYPGEYNNRLVIDKDNLVIERDENNNATNENYSISAKKKQGIKITDYNTFLNSLSAENTRHVVYENGVIRIVE